MKKIRYCADGYSVNGGRWHFWWEKYESFGDFKFALDNNIQG